MIYDWRKNAKGDFFGGLNAAIVALPLAMAFGVESGLGAAAGLIGAFVLCTITALIGGTPMMISGPTAPMTVVSAIIVVNTMESANTHAEGLATIFMIFFLAGAIQVCLGLFRVGQYIRFAPYPLISGFMSGVGLHMVLLQVFPLLGEAPKMHVMNVIEGMGAAISSANLPAIGLGLMTIAVIYLFPRLTKVVPSTLVALVGVTAFSYFLPWRVPVIGDIPGDWLEWKWSHLQDFDHTMWKEVFIPACTLAVVGSVDTLLTSLVVDMFTRSEHKSNRELIGQGIGNMLSSLAGGLPGSGATVRTAMNIRSGAKTRWSAIIHSAFLLLVLLEVSTWISYIPLSVLAGILITVGVSIIDFKGLRDLRKLSVSDVVVIIVVLMLTLFVGVLQAFAAGIILASVFFVKKMADKNMTQTEPMILMPENEDGLADLHPAYLARQVYIQEFSGPLFFGFASHFKQAFQAMPYMRAVIFRMEQVPFIDQSGVVAMKDVLEQLKRKQIVIIMTGLQKEPREQLQRMEVIPGIVDEDQVFRSFGAGADWLVKHLKDNPRNQGNEMVMEKALGFDQLKHRLN